jgi:hypothetical protein
MAFSLPFYTTGQPLSVHCQPNPMTNKTDWMYTMQNKSLGAKIPGIKI